MCVFCVRICTDLRTVCGFCVHIPLCVRRTDFALKVAYAYMYGFCNLSGLCVQIRLLRVKRLILQHIGDSFDVAMTVVLDVVRFVRRSDDRCDGCYMIRPT